MNFIISWSNVSDFTYWISAVSLSTLCGDQNINKMLYKNTKLQ